MAALLTLSEIETGDAASAVARLAAVLRADPPNRVAASRLVSALVHRNWALPRTAGLQHGKPVLMATFSPDGRYLLSASWDTTARIWDTATGVQVAELPHEDGVFLARYSPDGRRILTASRQDKVRVWSAAHVPVLLATIAHKAALHCAEFSPDGSLVVTGSADGTAGVWDGSDGTLKWQLPEHAPGEIVAARFSPGQAPKKRRCAHARPCRIFMLHQVLPNPALLS